VKCSLANWGPLHQDANKWRHHAQTQLAVDAASSARQQRGKPISYFVGLHTQLALIKRRVEMHACGSDKGKQVSSFCVATFQFDAKLCDPNRSKSIICRVLEQIIRSGQVMKDRLSTYLPTTYVSCKKKSADQNSQELYIHLASLLNWFYFDIQILNENKQIDVTVLCFDLFLFLFICQGSVVHPCSSSSQRIKTSCISYYIQGVSKKKS